MGANSHSSYRHPDRVCSTKGLWVLAVVVFAVLYGATCQRGPSWQDSGRHQWYAWRGECYQKLGLALAHPLYIAAGHVLRGLPVADFATRLNAFTGLGMAVALANLAALVAALTNRRWIGLAAAGMLAVAHTVWWVSTLAETYAWQAAALTTELCLLVRLIRRPRWHTPALLGLVAGLGWAIHNMALLALPVHAAVAVAMVARRRLPAWALSVGLAAFLAGAAPLLVLVAAEATAGGSVVAALRSALFGKYASAVLNVAGVSPHLKANAGLAAMNLAGLLVPLAVVGWLNFRSRLGAGLAAALGAITVIELAFVARYPVPDQFMFLVPSLTMIALAAGVGLATLADRSKGWRLAAALAAGLSIAAGPAFCAAAPHLARKLGVGARRESRVAFRDEYRYWLVPWKHDESSARHFAAAALAQAAPDGVILADGTARYPLLIAQATSGASGGVLIPDDGPGDDGELLGRGVYTVQPSAALLPPGRRAGASFKKRPHDPLYRVEWEEPGGRPSAP